MKMLPLQPQTADQFLKDHGHTLMRALHMAWLGSERDIANPDASGFIIRMAREDREKFIAMHDLIDTLRQTD